MKETKFIEQNKKKWKRFESLSKSSHADPDEISKLFVEITDDLSYARTHYPKRTVRVYLNQLAQGVFLNLYKARKAFSKRLITFWTDELPLEMYRARKVLLFNFLFVLIAIGIGAVSTANDPTYPAVILGQDYVEMTDYNIERGDPMAVYKSADKQSMFVHIARNNLQVAFFAFAFGICFSVGTLIFMLFNGVMIGAFTYYFYLKGAFVVAQSAIWLHGAFEISAIIIAGAAGVVIGNSLLFPGTYTRGQSLIIGGKRGIKIMIGTIPFIVVAAYIESYVTRGYLDMPEWQNWTIISVSMAIILAYFVIYPILKFRGTDDKKIDKDPVFKRPAKMEKWKIRKVSQIFTATFTWYKRIFQALGGWMVSLFLLHFASAVTYLYFDGAIDRFHSTEQWRDLLYKITGLSNQLDPVLMGIHVFFISLNASLIWLYFKNQQDRYPFKDVIKHLAVNVLKVALFLVVPFLIIHFGKGGVHFISILGMAFIMMGAFTFVLKNNPGDGIKSSFKGFFDNIALFVVFFLFVVIVHYFMTPLVMGQVEFPSNFIYDQVKSLLIWHAVPIFDNPAFTLNAFDALFYIAIAQFILPLFFIAYALQYYSVKEKTEAHGLFERLKTFGNTSKVYETDQDYTM